VESAWTYQHRPNVEGRVRRRQKSRALSQEAKRIAWKAQQRLRKRFTTLAARGKHRSQIVTALARELLGFLWAIAVHTEAQFQLKKAA
jgi:transposase